VKDFANVKTLGWVKHFIETLNPSSVDDLKDKKKELKEMSDAIRSVVGKVNEQKGRLTSLFNKALTVRENRAS